MRVSKGDTRVAVVLGKYTFKFPRVDLFKRKRVYGRWEMLCKGVLANMSEKRFSVFSRCYPVAPILFSLPLGLMNVMPATRPLSDEDWKRFQKRKEVLPVPVEPKKDSYGWLDARVVAVDYAVQKL